MNGLPLVLRTGLMLALLMLNACVSTQFEAPRLSLVSVGMVSADVFSQQFRIRLHVQNPNDRDLPIKGIEYALSLQGDSFAEGISNQPFVVPALGEAEFDTLVTTNFMSSVARLLSKLNSSDGSKVQYQFVGRVLLSEGMVRKIPFNEQGTVDLGIKK
jgi:LEA14-like dessication related protein